MTLFWSVLAVLSEHPAQTFVGLVIVGLVLFLGTGLLLYRHEEQKAKREQAERQKWQRIASANSESRGWPTQPGPKGFGGKGRAA